jgi:hypothetical protein
LKQNPPNIQAPSIYGYGTIITVQIELVNTAQLSQYFTLNSHQINGIKRSKIFSYQSFTREKLINCFTKIKSEIKPALPIYYMLETSRHDKRWAR